MKVLVKRRPLKSVLQWTQGLFFAAAIVLLGYYGFVAADAWIFEKRENLDLQRLLDHQASAHSTPFGPAGLAPGPPAITASGLIGRIEITRLGLSAILIEGISTKTLRRAVGHIPGTPLPGEPGNVGISGHRDTFFRPLRNIRRSDVITLTTLRGEYRYRVLSTKVVGPRDVAVLNPSRNEILTLVTCYPFYFVGPAPDRFIVRAERMI
jgi:sortase A